MAVSLSSSGRSRRRWREPPVRGRRRGPPSSSNVIGRGGGEAGLGRGLGAGLGPGSRRASRSRGRRRGPPSSSKVIGRGGGEAGLGRGLGAGLGPGSRRASRVCGTVRSPAAFGAGPGMARAPAKRKERRTLACILGRLFQTRKAMTGTSLIQARRGGRERIQRGKTVGK